MKEKVLKVLKPLLAEKGFTKTELEGLAEIAVKNLTEASTEEEINNVANGMIPYAEMMQKIGNRYASNIEKKYEGWIDPRKKVEEDTKSKNEVKSMTQEDIQKLINEGISNGIATALKPYKEREEKNRLQKLLSDNEKVKNIPEVFRGKYSLDKEEDLDAVATQIENDYAALKKSLLDSGEFATPPSRGNEKGESDDLIEALKNMGGRSK